MKAGLSFLLLLPFLITACGRGNSYQVPAAQLPDPAIYGLTKGDLPEVGLSWENTYHQTNTEEGYKWAYLAYQAYQPGNPGAELESGFAINNDVVLYEVDVSREELPQPPDTMGNIQGISWEKAAQPHQLGDRSAVWKTTLGDMFTPAWWLEFYQDHAYVRISLLGFPDQIAPSILYGMGDVIAERLPGSIDELLSDSTSAATQAVPTSTAFPQVSPYPLVEPVSPTSTDTLQLVQLTPLSYQAPVGETGMVTFFDDSGDQLSDGSTGTDDILADQGQGTGYEWVGWTDSTEPVTMTFSFEGEPTIDAVSIGFNHRDGLGVSLPRVVKINGVSFDVSADEVPNNQRGDVIFTGHFTGPKVEITLFHQGRGWIMVDEVRFNSVK